MIEIIPNYHPFFVHFTIALLLLSCGLFIISFLFAKNSKWGKNCLIAARWNLYIGIAFTVGTLLAGWQAYNSVVHDAPSHAVMTDHRNWAFVTAAFFVLIGIWAYMTRHAERITLIFVLFLLIGSGLLLTTGYKGGESVFRYGLGVMSLPNSDVIVVPTEKGDSHDDHAH